MAGGIFSIFLRISQEVYAKKPNGEKIHHACNIHTVVIQ